MKSETKQIMTKEERNKIATYRLKRDLYKTKYPKQYNKLVESLKHIGDAIGVDTMLYVLMEEVKKNIKSDD